jgi:DNA polymerase-3 subunit alpha
VYKAKSALAEGGRALHLPKWELDKIAKVLVERPVGDARSLKVLEDTFTTTEEGKKFLNKYPAMALAARIEGHPQNAGQHAAGIVISKGLITSHVAVDSSKGVAMCDLRDAEKLNLIKIDMLGLTQLSVFERAFELINDGSNIKTLEALPLDEAHVFDVLNRKNFCGVFQFTGKALQGIAEKFTITSFEDIVSTTALARPGPMHSGGADKWVLRRAGRRPVTYYDPVFEKELKDTLGIIIYQEQVMNIGRNIGGLSWPDVIAMRKAMGKSQGFEALNKFGDPWKAGAIAKGVPQDVAVKVWREMCEYGAYAFNKSHSVAYAMLSYWCCWFKAYHPVEFAAATLDQEKDPLTQIAILTELGDEGLNYVAVDPDFSTDKWAVKIDGEGRKVLVGPLSNIRGIGPKAVQDIIAARKSGAALKPAMASKLKAAKTPIDTLTPVGDRVAELVPDLAKMKIDTKPTPINGVQCNGKTSTFVVIGILQTISPRENSTLKMFMKDDSGEIYAQIDGGLFDTIGKDIIDRGKARRAIYAFKGECPSSFRMIKVNKVKYLGDMA